ncbi:MAG: AMP-binding protein [Candidatus Latescibacteria bacterium]|nr:AMP-binding protein [Candidatus Latescibacterota bacterium]
MPGLTLKDLMNRSFSQWADRTAVRLLSGSPLEYRPLSYAQLQTRRDHLASGLQQLGLVKGKRVGILTDGGFEPLLVFLAADLIGVSAVPLCNKSPDEILTHSINHSAIAALVLDAKGLEQVERIGSSLENSPQLILTQEEGEGVLSFAAVEKTGQERPYVEVEVAPGDESKILYTSGSSGLPKGVIQTHANIVANVEEVWDRISRDEPFRLFKSAPDYHAMGILNIYYPLAKGWVLDMARSPDRVLTDIRLSEPEGFLTVPLVLDKVFANVRKEIDAGGAKGWLVGRSVRAKQNVAQERASVGDRLVAATIGKKIVAVIRANLAQRVGRHLKLLIVGSAKADPEALNFFQDVLDITTFEGYGTTECAPLIAANTLTGRKVGTVGLPLLEVQLVDAAGQQVGHGDPERGVYRGSGERVGELWVHGANVMRGYLDEPERTAETLVQDDIGKTWYRTGDLFSMDEEGYLTFRGRLGRQFKLRNGEFVNPELLERLFARIPLAEHVLVGGDQSRTFPLPLVSIDIEEAQKLDIPDLPKEDEAALRVHPKVAERVRQQLLQEATAAALPVHERPQKVLLIPQPLSEEDGTLTRGLKKIVPGVVSQRYAELIERTYAD